MSSDAVIWATDATQKLHHAQTIGAKANTLLLQTRNIVKEYDEKLSKGNFLLDAIDQQLQVLETIQKRVRSTVEKRSKTVFELSDYLASSIDDLEMEYQNLKDIEIDKGLQSKSDTLYDLVTTDILEQLNSKDKDVNDICRNCVAELKERERMVLNKIKSFMADFNRLESKTTSLNDNTWVDPLLEEIYTYEEEIASLIESVTGHYDQCSRGLQVSNGELKIPEEDQRELFQVLAKDFNELPDVINDIEETFGDIETRCTKIIDFNKDHTLLEQITKLLKSLTQFGEHDLKSTKQMITSHTITIVKVANEVGEKCQESKQIITHYQQFTRAYYSLILEIHRRQETKMQIEKVLQETKSKLMQIQDDDYRKRNQFLSLNGAFLPSDLYLGINDVEEPLFKLNYELTEVPGFDRELVGLAERRVRSRDSSV